MIPFPAIGTTATPVFMPPAANLPAIYSFHKTILAIEAQMICRRPVADKSCISHRKKIKADPDFPGIKGILRKDHSGVRTYSISI